MLSPKEVREFVVRPALKHIGLWSEIAEELVLLTGMMESRFSHIVQNRGPALGLFQMEPATYQDIKANFLEYRGDLKERALSLKSSAGAYGPEELMTNLSYAAAMCRVHYYRVQAPLPPPELKELAWYWKTHYNTILGKGKAKDFIEQGRRMWKLEQIPYNAESDWKGGHHNLGSQGKDV